MLKQLETLWAAATPTELIVATLVILVSFIILVRLILSSSKSRGPDITLITGPCGSGKTLLFHHWQSPEIKIKTVTSQCVNRGKVFGKNEIVDYPGHPRLRGGLIGFLPRANKIVFLVNEDLKSASELLYDILVTKSLRPSSKMLICTDSTKNIDSLVKNLNAQMELLRTSRMQGELEGDIDQYLGVDGEAFDLRTHSPIIVQFGTASVANGQVDDIESFIASN